MTASRLSFRSLCAVAGFRGTAKRQLSRVFGGAALLLVTACASDSTPRVLLALPPAIDSKVTATAFERPMGLPILAVRRIAIPEYMESRRVRFRAETSTLGEWPNTYWAERIEAAVTRELVAALGSNLPTWTLCDSSCGSARPDLALQIDLAPMDFVRPERHLVARAHVTLAPAAVTTDAGDGNAIRTQDLAFDIPARGDTPQAHAEAITELLRQLAVRVAPLVLQQVPARR